MIFSAMIRCKWFLGGKDFVMPKFDFSLNLGHLLQVLILTGFGAMVIIEQGTRIEILTEHQKTIESRLIIIQEILQKQIDQMNQRLVIVEDRTNRELQHIRQVLIDINRKVQ